MQEVTCLSRAWSREPTSSLGIASYLIISKYVEVNNRAPSGLYFNKLMSLLHRNMKEAGVDLRLPHFWYRYGDEVVRSLLPSEIEWNHEDAPRTYVKWKKDPPVSVVDTDFLAMLRNHVDDLTDNYAGPGGLEEAVRAVYENAPFEFQRRYKDCRDGLHWIMRSRIEWKEVGDSLLMPRIKSACESFPVNEFPQVAESLPIFKATMDHTLSRSSPDLHLASELVEEFWFWFCYHLRLHPKGHENVPRESIDIWEERVEWENSRYRRLLGDHLVAMANSDAAVRRDPELLPLVLAREKERAEEREMISSSADDFAGLDEFIRDLRNPR